MPVYIFDKLEKHLKKSKTNRQNKGNNRKYDERDYLNMMQSCDHTL